MIFLQAINLISDTFYITLDGMIPMQTVQVLSNAYLFFIYGTYDGLSSLVL